MVFIFVAKRNPTATVPSLGFLGLKIPTKMGLLFIFGWTIPNDELDFVLLNCIQPYSSHRSNKEYARAEERPDRLSFGPKQQSLARVDWTTDEDCGSLTA